MFIELLKSGFCFLFLILILWLAETSEWPFFLHLLYHLILSLAKGGDRHRRDGACTTAREARARECWGGRRRRCRGDGGQSRRLERVLQEAWTDPPTAVPLRCIASLLANLPICIPEGCVFMQTWTQDTWKQFIHQDSSFLSILIWINWLQAASVPWLWRTGSLVSSHCSSWCLADERNSDQNSQLCAFYSSLKGKIGKTCFCPVHIQ